MVLKRKKLVFFLLFVPMLALGIVLWHFYETRIIRLDYDGFTVWLDCGRRGAVRFRYIAKVDHGKLDRSHIFSIDPDVSRRCQQTTTVPYAHGDVPYDRGHLVPANHMDHSSKALKQSNYVTNILPQVAVMNRGAWLQTEEIIECYRDRGDLLVLGGVIWGNTPADDYFKKSHGVATPDAFWKVIVRWDGEVIAWIVANSTLATRQALRAADVARRRRGKDGALARGSATLSEVDDVTI